MGLPLKVPQVGGCGVELLLGKTMCRGPRWKAPTPATPHSARPMPGGTPPPCHHPAHWPSRSMHPTLRGRSQQAARSQARGRPVRLGQETASPWPQFAHPQNGNSNVSLKNHVFNKNNKTACGRVQSQLPSTRQSVGIPNPPLRHPQEEGQRPAPRAEHGGGGGRGAAPSRSQLWPAELRASPCTPSG